MIQKSATLFFLLSTTTWAQGFYIGTGIGPDTADFKQSASVIVQTPGSTSITSNVQDDTRLSGTGVFGTVFAGYGWNKQKFYLAGEANANASSLEFNSDNKEFVNNSISNTHYRIQNNFGLSILPGYLYTPTTLFYFRLGYANGSIKISTTDSSIANINKNLSGLRLGFGINQTFTQRIGARMEYSHIAYQQTHFTVISGAATKSTQITPTTNQVEFSIIFNLG